MTPEISANLESFLFAEPVAGLRPYPVWQDMGIAVGDGSGFHPRYDEQSGSYLEQYPLEKPCAAGSYGVGGGSGAFGQRFADADGVP